jgi:hypothetical protein
VRDRAIVVPSTSSALGTDLGDGRTGVRGLVVGLAPVDGAALVAATPNEPQP